MSYTGVIYKRKDNGYGFILQDDTKEDIFCHYKSLESQNFDDFICGAKVSFDVTITDTGKKQAIRVKVINRGVLNPHSVGTKRSFYYPQYKRGYHHSLQNERYVLVAESWLNYWTDYWYWVHGFQTSRWYSY